MSLCCDVNSVIVFYSDTGPNFADLKTLDVAKFPLHVNVTHATNQYYHFMLHHADETVPLALAKVPQILR